MAQRKPAPLEIGAPRLVDGISYFDIEGAPAKAFRCTALSSTLLIPACAKRFAKAQQTASQIPNQLEKCLSCPIGAAHAGLTATHTSRTFGASMCRRCGRYSAKLIGGRKCPSCYNRGLELARGINGKGTAPVSAWPLHARTLRYTVDGEQRTLTVPDSRDAAELCLHALSTVRGHIEFISCMRGHSVGPKRSGPEALVEEELAALDGFARGKASFKLQQKADGATVLVEGPTPAKPVADTLRAAKAVKPKIKKARPRGPDQAAEAEGRPKADRPAATGRVEAVAYQRRQAIARAVDLALVVSEIIAEGARGPAAIARGLKARGVPAARGGSWKHTSARALLARLAELGLATGARAGEAA
jgi:hypothetical protein